MPLKQHPTDPDKMVYDSRQYDIPQLQGVTTTQRPWVDLTDEEIDELRGSPMKFENSAELTWVRIIEAKLKEKNFGN